MAILLYRLSHNGSLRRSIGWLQSALLWTMHAGGDQAGHAPTVRKLPGCRLPGPLRPDPLLRG